MTDGMTGAELRVVTEYLGIDQRALSRILGVDERTVRRWILATSPVPAGVAAEVEEMEAYTARSVGEVVAALHDARDPAVVIYADDRQMWAARPESEPYPARWWRMVVARACHEVPGVAIEYAT